MHKPECLHTFFHIIINEASSINWLEIVNCIISVVTLLGSAWCIVRIRKLKEKQLDSIFSFLTRLSIRLNIMSDALKEYKDPILVVLYSPQIRSEMIEYNTLYSESVAKIFLKHSQDTMTFILDTNDQIPLKQGWLDKYNKLIEFLDTYVKTEDENFFLWPEKETKSKDDFYSKHIKNIDEMIKDISDAQKEIEKKLPKKGFI